MNLNSKKYEDQYLAAPQSSLPVNDAAEKYRVTIAPAQVPDGQRYWRVIGVHHLLQEENQRSQNIFVEALDELGHRIRQGKLFAASTFDGQQGGPTVSALDKADADPMGCDFPMFKETVYSVWINGAARNSGDPSDRVGNLSTRHPDEGAGNTFGHHSFLVVFQRTLKGPAVLDEGAVHAAALKLRDELVAGNTPFAVFARTQNLGAPITTEFTAGGFQARGYCGGIVYAPLSQPNNIKLLNW